MRINLVPGSLDINNIKLNSTRSNPYFGILYNFQHSFSTPRNVCPAVISDWTNKFDVPVFGMNKNVRILCAQIFLCVFLSKIKKKISKLKIE
jgi:hypothetical protein